MKLSELLFEAKIVKEELDIRSFTDGRGRTKWEVFDTEDPSTRVGTTYSNAGDAEEFRDAERARRANPNAEPSRPARSQPRAGAPDKTPVPKADVSTNRLTKGLTQVADNKWILFLPDGKTILEITNEADANLLQDVVEKLENDGKTPQQITRALSGSNLSNISGLTGELPKVTSNPIKRVINAISLNEFEAKRWAQGNPVTKWISGTGFKIIKGLARILGNPFMDVIGVFLGVMAAIGDVKDEIEQAAGDSARIRELETEAEILSGQLYVMLVASLIPFLRIGKWARLIVRLIARTIQGGIAVAGGVATAATAGAAAPVTLSGTVLGIVLVEGGSFIVFAMLSNPDVQRWIAQTIAGTVLGDFVAGAGQMGNQAISNLEQWLDGKYGTKFLKDSLTVDEKIVGGREGEYYGNSEWAKLVFGALLFPEGTPTKLVPFIPESRREELLSNTLNIQSENATPELSNQTNAENNPFPALDPNASPEELLPPQSEPSVNSGGPGFRAGQ